MLDTVWAYFSPNSDETTFSQDKLVLWIEDSYFSWKQQFEVKNVLMINLLITNIHFFASQEVRLTDGLELYGIFADYDVFISYLF